MVPFAMELPDRVPKQRYYDPEFFALEAGAAGVWRDGTFDTAVFHEAELHYLHVMSGGASPTCRPSCRAPCTSASPSHWACRP